MSDDNYKNQSSENQFKEVKVTIGGGARAKTIWQVFGGSDPSQYFAGGGDSIHLYLDNEMGVSFKVSAKYVNVLNDLMKKFKESTVGIAMNFIQKMADFSSALDLGNIKTRLLDKKDSLTSEDVLSRIKVFPPNVRYQTKYQNLPAWDSTGPMELGSFTFRFYLGMAGQYDGRTEVYNPALAFMKVNHPVEISDGMLQGPLPNTAWVYGVIGKSLGEAVSGVVQAEGANTLRQVNAENGPAKPTKVTVTRTGPTGKYPVTLDITDRSVTPAEIDASPEQAAYLLALESYKKTKGAAGTPTDYRGSFESNVQAGLNSIMDRFEKNLSDAIDNWPGTGLVQVSIGQFVLPKMTVRDTEVKFSYDTDSNGYPIWAEVTWSGCETLEMATVNQMPLRTEKATPTLAAVGEANAADMDSFHSVVVGTEAAPGTLAKRSEDFDNRYSK